VVIGEPPECLYKASGKIQKPPACDKEQPGRTGNTWVVQGTARSAPDCPLVPSTDSLVLTAVDFNNLIDRATFAVFDMVPTGSVNPAQCNPSFITIQISYTKFGTNDADGAVGINDFLALLGAWGPCPDPSPTPSHPADLDGDCAVGINDLLNLLANWGPCL
jgi:hypothetical protein